MKRIGVLISLGILAFIFIWGILFSHPAVSQQIESRLNNLEADFNRLQSEVNQLQLSYQIVLLHYPEQP